MARKTRSSGKKRTSKYVDYSSTDAEEDLEEYVTSEEEEVKPKKTTSRVPKKKLKKSTEERIKEVVGDSQTVDEEEENGEMVDEGESVSINTKRLLDARSKKAKRMDWEQGFFYLPKFDCYLPRHILHMILEYVPPFPYFLNIRSISQQWLDDFDTVICQNVKELDLVQRNDIDYELVRYKFPWYDNLCSTRRNNDCIRFLAILFPNVEKLIVPAIGATVRVPNNVLKLFHKLETMQIFYVSPLTVDVSYTPAEIPLTYRQDITNVQSITYNRYLTQFTSSLVMVKDENSTLVTLSNSLIPEDVISLFKYLVKEQHFSLKRLYILSLPETLYSKTLIDFILEENVKHVERGYGYPELSPNSFSIYINDNEIAEYMTEKQFFKSLINPKEIASYDWEFISQILSGVTNLKIFKMLFEQSEFPLIFDQEMNPLLWIIKNNVSRNLPEIVEFLCTLKPSVITLGNARGVVNGDEKNLNILHLYITTCNNEYNIDERVIASLIKVGCDTNFVCPTTGNNLVHIHPCSPALIDALSVEFLQMKNNKGYNPFERLIKRIEVEKNIRNDELYETIDAFGKAYKKHGLPINDIKFDKNQNLLHKFISLPNANGVVEKLITHGVDANAVDDDGNLPLFYFIGANRLDADLKAFIGAISDETLSKRFHNKSLLTNIIERFQPEESNSYFYFGTSSGAISTLDLIENILSRGSNLYEALLETSDGYYEKDNLDLNVGIFLIQILHSINTTNLETLRKLSKYFKNFEAEIIKPFTVKDTLISPLLYLLSLWKNYRSNRQNDMYQTFHSDNPLISPHVLENIIDIPNKKIDALFYTIITSTNATNWQYMESILSVKIDNSTGAWWYRPTNFADIAKSFASYRYEHEVFGNLNIVQLATVMGADSFLVQIEQAFSSANASQMLADLTNEPFLNGSSILDELAKRGMFSAGNVFLKKASQSNPLEWNINHFRSAFKSSHYEFCYQIINGPSKHDFTKEEIMQILIGLIIQGGSRYIEDKPSQLEMTEIIGTYFAGLTIEEKFKYFGTRFKIIVNKEIEVKEGKYYYHGSNWKNILDLIVSETKLLWAKTETTSSEPIEYCLSLLDVCYWRGLIYLFSYLVLEDTTGRKKKNIIVHSELSQETLVSWLTKKCENTGKTLLHIACNDLEHAYYADNYSCSVDMVNDLVKYLSSIDREDIINIQDNEGKTPLFYSLESGNFAETFLKVSDLKIKNNKGETVQDLLDDEEKKVYASYFEEKVKPQTKSTKKKKKESDEEEKPKRRTTRNSRKKKESSDEDEIDEDSDEDFEEKPRKKRTVTRKRK